MKLNKIDFQSNAYEKSWHFYYRKWVNYFILGLIGCISFILILPLVSIFVYIVQKGLSGINLALFTQLPAAIGMTGGGLANAILGSFWLVLGASLLAIPWGLFLGIFLSEYENRLSTILRYVNDVLTSIPSIVVGLFMYALVVKPLRNFSALSGTFALAFIMTPLIARTSEEILRLVPNHLKEAGLALGLPRWKVLIFIVLGSAKQGLTTSILLAIARISGETAPLLFTAFNNQYWNRSWFEPTSSLPVQIFTYAISPFEEWQNLAWSGALVLICFILLLNLIVRLWFQRKPNYRG